jgi:protein-tyrosine phosphatase
VLVKLVSQKRKVYVHCKNGHGRASTLMAGYLISKGSTVEDAINLIKEKRPTMHLQDSQKEALRIFAKNI